MQIQTEDLQYLIDRAEQMKISSPLDRTIINNLLYNLEQGKKPTDLTLVHSSKVLGISQARMLAIVNPDELNKEALYSQTAKEECGQISSKFMLGNKLLPHEERMFSLYLQVNPFENQISSTKNISDMRLPENKTISWRAKTRGSSDKDNSSTRSFSSSSPHASPPNIWVGLVSKAVSKVVNLCGRSF